MTTGRAPLNDRFTFDRLVIGDHNRRAVEACQRFAEGREAATLLMHGGSGLRKTHLLHAIGHGVLERRPSAPVALLTAERFADRIFAAIRDGRTRELRHGFHRLEVLLFDDLDLLVRKAATLKAFLRICAGTRRLVATNRLAPMQFPGAAVKALFSRPNFRSVALHPPDYHDRRAILAREAEEHGLPLEDEILDSLAAVATGSVRPVEAALLRRLAFNSLVRRGLSVQLDFDVFGATRWFKSTRCHPIVSRGPADDRDGTHACLCRRSRLPWTSCATYMRRDI